MKFADIFLIFIALLWVVMLAAPLLKAHALHSNSQSKFTIWLRKKYALQRIVKVYTFIDEATRHMNGNHQIRDILYTEIGGDSIWKSTYLYGGWDACQHSLADLIDRVREFVNEWTEHQYLYSGQLTQIWSVERTKYLTRTKTPIPPEQQ